jgi:ATP-dependent Zn protease
VTSHRSDDDREGEDHARLTTAHHEAGHAVVACVVGDPYELVSLVEDASDDRAGGLKSLPLPHQLGEPFLSAAAVLRLQVVYSGSLAEARFLGSELEVVWMSRYSRSDRDCARHLVNLLRLSLGPGDHERVALASAENTVEANRTSICAVAHRLVERDELSPEAVAEIVSATGGSPRFP